MCKLHTAHCLTLPVWLKSHLQLLKRGAASPLLCCDSRLFHQTAGPPPASADWGAADAGSVVKNKKYIHTYGTNFNLSNSPETRMQQWVCVEHVLTRWPSSSLRSAAEVRVPALPGTSRCILSFVTSAQTNRTNQSAIMNNILVHIIRNLPVRLYLESWCTAQCGTGRVQCAVCRAHSAYWRAESGEGPQSLQVAPSWGLLHLPSFFPQEQQTELQSPDHVPGRTEINLVEIQREHRKQLRMLNLQRMQSITNFQVINWPSAPGCRISSGVSAGYLSCLHTSLQ